MIGLKERRLNVLKNNVTALLILVLFCILISITAYSSYTAFRLQNQLDTQNKILSKYQTIDDRISKGETGLLSALESFLGDSTFVANGKSMGTSDFLIYHNSIRDSLDMYKRFYTFSEDKYGVKLKRSFDSDSSHYRVESIGITRADSSAVLFRHYNHKISLDKNGNWVIEGDYKQALDDLFKDFNQKISERDNLINNTKKQVSSLRTNTEQLLENYENYKGALNELISKNIIVIDSTQKYNIKILKK